MIANRFHTFNVVFNCKPQIFYERDTIGGSFLIAPDAGSRPLGISVNQPFLPGASIISGMPKMEIYAAGDVSFSFESNPGGPTLPGLVLAPYHAATEYYPAYYEWPSAVLDSEAMVCYRNRADGTRENIDIDFFPILKKSMNFVSLWGSVKGVNCYPRWWGL